MRTHAWPRWWKLLVIGSVVLAIAGCGTLRMAYVNGPALAAWHVDRWFDVDGDQAPSVRAATERWFAWHRRTQLAPTAALLGEARTRVTQPLTADDVCGFYERVQGLTQPAIDRAVAEAADLVPLLTDANLEAMLEKGGADIAKDRREHLHPDDAKRRAKALDRARKRFERLYGPLETPQLAVLRDGLPLLPLEPERWLADRERGHQETAAVLRRLVAERAPREQRLAALTRLVGARTAPVDPDRRARQQRLVQANCELVARVHNSTTPAQREQARDNLQSWETDLRRLLGAS